MKPRRVTATALLAFVAASLFALAATQLCQAPKRSQKVEMGMIAAGGEKETSTADKRVVAYYFHGNVRCPTCVAIEYYSERALKTRFAQELDSGRLQWRAVNYDEPENRRFALDYKLAAPSLVLVAMDGEKQMKWEILPEVWKLAGDKRSFFRFVQRRTREFLDEWGGKPQPTGSAGAANLSPTDRLRGSPMSNGS